MGGDKSETSGEGSSKRGYYFIIWKNIFLPSDNLSECGVFHERRSEARSDDSLPTRNGGKRTEKRTRKSDEEKRALSRGKPTTAALTPDSHELYQHSDKLYPVLCFSSYVANIVVLPRVKKTAID